MRDLFAKRGAMWAILALILFLRLFWHACEPIGIVGDEAYYWDWGRKLDWGYFSKPPGIAWLHRLVAELGGQSAYGIKACAALLATSSVAFLFLAVRKFSGDTIARSAACILVLSPGNLLLGSFLTTDAPLVFFWNGGLWMIARIMHEEKPKGSHFFHLWLAISMGSLFKQMMMMQIILLAIAAVWMRRDLLRRWELFAASVGSLVVLVPSLMWNYSNDWITFQHTAHHFAPAKLGLGPFLSRIGELFGVTALLVSPVVFILCLMAVASVSRALRSQTQAIQFFWIWGALPFCFCALMTLRQQVNPNWPIVYISPLVVMAFLLFQSKKKFWKWAFCISLSMTLIAMTVPFLMNTIYQYGWIKPQLRGWEGYKELAASLDRFRRQDDAIVVIGHRFSASHLAFHLHDHPSVWLWNDSGEIRSQYDLWNAPPTRANLLLVVEDKGAKNAPRTPPDVFDGAEYLASVPLHPARPEQKFHFYRSKPLAHWPQIGENPH
jgi:4-amino-4-deoxy-L-arabinose transferase-like glycosyltransferase